MSKSRIPVVTLSAHGERDVTTLLATVSLGLIEAVREGCISPAEAADVFFISAFLPFSDSDELEPLLIDALHEGSELEDIAQIAPEGLVRALGTIRRNALSALRRRRDSPRPATERWIQRTRIERPGTGTKRKRR